jgi:DNA-damage-inducible protein J
MTTTLRIDDKLKADCDAVFSDLGINMTSAITLFLKQVVRTRGIPFEISCMPYIINNRIEDKLAEARADVAAGRVKPMDQVMNRLRSKFNVYA